MQPEQQQRILGYFIEEAREHLAVIEHSLLNLPRVVAEPERLNEVFRAAHSVKGGAAMLGITSMQRIAHQLEEGFKILQAELVPVDQTLESLFLRIFDVLSGLLERLQASPELSDEDTNQALATTQPLFANLKTHVAALKQKGQAATQQPLSSLEELSIASEQEVFPQVDLPETDPDLADLDTLVTLFNSSEWQDSSSPAAPFELPVTHLEDLDSLLSNWDEALDPDQEVEAVEALDLLDQLWVETVASEETASHFLTLDAHAEVDSEPVTVSEAPDRFDSLLQELETDTTTEIPAPEDLQGQVIDISATSTPGGFSSTPLYDSPASPTVVPTDTSASNRALGGQTQRMAVKDLDHLNNLVGELVINRNSLTQNQERLRQFLNHLLSQVHELAELGQQVEETYERSLLERSLLSPPPAVAPPAQPPAPDLNQDSVADANSTTGFDALELDRFSHFHTLAQEITERLVRVREAAADIEFVTDETDQVLSVFRQITGQLQEGLTRSRMVPFAQVADRLPRAVRELAHQWAKQADLEIEGRETLVDKRILERLYDPLTHLVSNALTHGIETPEVRSAAGKPAQGLIKLQAQHQGNQMIISIADDGAGIDLERVKAKALEQGLIAPAAAAQLSRAEVYNLLFHPGFSTIDEAHELAGRGIGMDAVRANLKDLRGTISIDSVPGQGTTLTLRLPLTLSISKALCCLTHQQLVAFPMDSVEEILELPADQFQGQAGAPPIVWKGLHLPCHRLSEFLIYHPLRDRNPSHSTLEADTVAILILRGGAEEFLALQVDQVLTEQETVIKQLEGPAPKPLGIGGVTVLGDGRVMLIADALELIDLASGRLQLPTDLWAEETAPPAPTRSEPQVLIVDDSITVRELLSLTFGKFGYRVAQARDGREAWDKLVAGFSCDLIFCDIEMPRMDGFELLSRIQQHPDLARIPVAMLTSRGSERHQHMAAQLGAKAYFTKPYLEESLLEASQRLLQGETLLKP
jgi:chemotaxis protein histidine kinase CheA/ActR/RegA family two-component response regulator